MEEKVLHEHECKPKKDSLTYKVRNNPWMLASILLAILSLILLITHFSGAGITGNIISKDKAGKIILDFAEEQTGETLELVDVVEEFGMYKVTVLYQDSKIPLYLTKDGENLVQGVTPLALLNQAADNTDETPQEVVKSDKPEVELFVMTHCPYGTQAEKGFIPVMELLNGVADLKIRFVHYFMHDPEEAETPRQVCIREEQEDKYLDYLKCFLEDGNAERCLAEADIDEDALETCIKENADTYYAEDSKLSEEYGVQGSPTLVVNGVIVNSKRNPAAYLATVCNGFNTSPDECSESLDTTDPSAGFGYGVGSATTAQC